MCGGLRDDDVTEPRRRTGASRAHIFDHKIRRGPSNWHDLGDGNRLRKGPLQRAHVDQSYDGAVLALERALPQDDVDRVRGTRWQIVNVSFRRPGRVGRPSY